jgi:hypothetical protein
MRRTVVLVGLAVAAAGPALAQSNRGAFGLDAMIAPTTGFGFAYYITDGLSLRPWLGLGYSDYNGFFANVGAQLRFEPMAAAKVAPYVSAYAQYSHYGSSGVATVTTPQATGSRAVTTSGTATTEPLTLQSDFAQLGAGAGVRGRVSGSVSLFAEGRVMYTSAPMGSLGTGWSTVGINDRTRLEAVLGLTYLFH